MTVLLDVNVLLALFWPSHQFHSVAREWFHSNSHRDWATCTLTEAGFIRILAQPALIGIEVPLGEAMDLLADNCRHPKHKFWQLDSPLPALLPEIRSRLRGHKQLTDAILLDLAIRKGGQLVTLDRAIARLLAADSDRRNALEILQPEGV